MGGVGKRGGRWVGRICKVEELGGSVCAVRCVRLAEGRGDSREVTAKDDVWVVKYKSVEQMAWAVEREGA